MPASSVLFALYAFGITSPATATEPGQRVQLNFKMDAEFIKKYDKDGEGALSLTEFQDAMTEKLNGAIASIPGAEEKMNAGEMEIFREKIVAASFRSMDKNSDGALTVDELRLKPAVAQ